MYAGSQICNPWFYHIRHKTVRMPEYAYPALTLGNSATRVVYRGERISNFVCHSLRIPAAASAIIPRLNLAFTASIADISWSDCSLPPRSNSGRGATL